MVQAELLLIDQVIELEIERLGIYGEGVARHHGFTIFVDGALPGEKVFVKLIEKRKNFARAVVIERLKSSPQRVTPPCPLFGKCGGCQLMHLSYSEQLVTKRQRVVDAFERVGKIFECEILPCEPSPSPLAYRNKIQLPVVNGRLGLYAQNSHDLVEVEHCFIHNNLGEKVLAHVQRLLKASSLIGHIKHVLIKTAVHTQEALVVLVTGQVDPEALIALSEELMASVSEIKGVVQNQNLSQGNVILSQEFNTIVGQGWILEKLLGLSFKVSPASFFQVNPPQAEKLYQKVLEFARLTGEEIVLDAFCGVGTLSLLLASAAKEVVGVECVSDAIFDAQKNAELNGIRNVRFSCAQAEEFISSLEKIDVAVLNPPRKGCETALLECLAKLKPSRIIYVSCDPATLARDLQILISNGYQITAVQPYDMFPQTAHVECVVGLSLLT
jgi:23S rRNA (uracil1939-C5)-methyltransferase